MAALRAALVANPFYVGALDSKRTHERRVQQLTDMGYRESDIAQRVASIWRSFFNSARTTLRVPSLFSASRDQAG